MRRSLLGEGENPSHYVVGLEGDPFQCDSRHTVSDLGLYPEKKLVSQDVDGSETLQLGPLRGPGMATTGQLTVTDKVYGYRPRV